MRIALFDFDNTLIKSKACVKVRNKDGQEIARFYDDLFRDYPLADGDYFDFEDMESAEVLETAQTTRYIETLREHVHRGDTIMILTSRGNANIIRDFLVSHNVYPVDIIAINSEEWVPLRHLPNAERKKIAVRRLYEKGYDEFIYYDDDEANLRAVASLDGPKIVTHLVKL